MLNGFSRGTAIALVLMGAAAFAGTHGITAAAAQDTGASPEAQVPGPNAAPPESNALPPAPKIPAQPVPGAMPGSATVPSALSAKNAADDKLITVAYTFKHLTPEQRRTIYEELKNAPPPGPAPSGEVGVELPPQVGLLPVPKQLADKVPEAGAYQYTLSNNKILLVSPPTRIVVGEFPG